MNTRFTFVPPCGVKDNKTDEVEYFETSAVAQANLKELQETYEKSAEASMDQAWRSNEDFLYERYEKDPYYETTNKFGFPQTMLRDPTGDIAVCSNCHCCVMENRGTGTQCDHCNHVDDMDCQAMCD